MDGEFEHTVENFVRHVIQTRGLADQAGKVRNVHRLDYATSGVVLMALTKHGAAIASEQFVRRRVSKTYVAILHGHLPEPADGSQMEWTWSIAPTDGFNMQAGTASNPGRSAKTGVHVLEHGMYYGTEVSKVLFSPESGRRHQLRVHAATAGYPIVGDASYIENETNAFFPTRPGFVPPRMMLHAQRLEIELPPASATVYGHKSGLRITTPHVFEAPDPFDDMPGLRFDRPGIGTELEHSTEFKLARSEGRPGRHDVLGRETAMCGLP
jgi:23S rRNA-/tRNA-specific pseudouridylate synthase